MGEAQEIRTPQAKLLRWKIELLLSGLVSASRRLIEHPNVRDLYPEYLVMSHGVIRASVPLMETARDRARETADDDSVSAALAPYLDEHIPEEADHDLWLLDDLEVLGRERSEILARPPSATVAALVGAQYYWVLHYHPVAICGYIAVLEGYPPTMEMVDELVSRTGYARDAFRTMIGHAELDPGHRDELDELLTRLPVTREQATVMGLSGMFTTHMYARAVEEVIENHG